MSSKKELSIKGSLIIDTFPAFLTYWSGADQKNLDDQVENWATEYMSPWPELLAKQIDDYTKEGINWRQIAREKVFPHLAKRIPAMREAHKNLLALCEPIHEKAKQRLSIDFDITYVIHVGIGCGAGWATTLNSKPAILFGLDNIAECGWSAPETIKGLIAHELGHLVHYSWRALAGKPIDSGPWWQLYEEGFAQICESRILNTDSVHQTHPGDECDWEAWCRVHAGWLAAEFLRTVDSGKPVSTFFGSWFEICGRSETGYFLGSEVIKELEKQLGLKEIALLDHAEAATRPILEQMTGQGEKVKPDEAESSGLGGIKILSTGIPGQRGVVLKTLRDLLVNIGSANDAEDHGYHRDAEQMRKDACDTIRSLMVEYAFLREIFPKLEWELDTQHILGFGWADLCDELEKLDAG